MALERPKPEQELKPAMNPLLQGIYNLMGGGLEGVMPNDPVIESLIKAGGFFKEQANDPLNYLGGGTVKGASLGTAFLVRRAEKIKALRREREIQSRTTDPIETAASQKEEVKLIKQLKKMDLEEANKTRDITKASAQTKTGRKNDFPPSEKTLEKLSSKNANQQELALTRTASPKPFDINELATQIRRNEEAGTPFVFRGERGIASLPNKPTYLTSDALDTRLPEFSKKSLKVMQPKFNKVLDVDKIPPKVNQAITDREMFRGRPSRSGGANQTDFDMERILGNIKDSANKTPSSINKETTDFFEKQGYDALRFPPRNFRGESDTLLSLDPVNNLKLFDEVPPDMVEDLMRELLRNKLD